MKRSLVTTVIVGVAVAGIVSVLHASGLIWRFERAVIEPISDYTRATRVVSEKWQYVFVPLLALGVAWLALTSVSRRGMRWLFLVLLIELLGLSWVCSLYRIFFQPLPPIFAVLLAWLVAQGWIGFFRRDRAHWSKTFFVARLSNKKLPRLLEGAIPFHPQPTLHQVTAVTSHLSKKHSLP